MESKQINNDNELRIRELFNVSIEKCTETANSQKWCGIILPILLPALLFWAFVEPPMMGLKVGAVVVIALLCFLYFKDTERAFGRVSQAGDVDELLARYNDFHKSMRRGFCLNYAVIMGTYFVLHFRGDWFTDLLHSLAFGIVLAIMCYFDIRDCEEIKEIKQLLADKKKCQPAVTF